ncbi:hypothetical protein MLD38_014397 [Melastoma candidum]|uniref:Uncharacterized protein n=1 Tax=Melastoma candidum TaxID=119954 RepID=A0ACB9RCR7_9MYRT|nr:hypothetical protein MLD38_014397 [Melastoma candidum]
MIAGRLKKFALRRIISRCSDEAKFFHAVNIEPVCQPFDEIPHRNVLPVNRPRPMVDSIHPSDTSRGILLFRERLRSGLPLNVDEFKVTLAFKSCGGDAVLVGQVHGFVVMSGFSCFTSVGNSLMSAYFKGGQFGDGTCVFESMEDPDVISWNTVISGCKTSEDALSWGVRMNLSGVAFNSVSYCMLLAFSAGHGGFLFGLQLHCDATKSGVDDEVFVGNALVSLYAKHDRITDARKAFDEISVKDVVSWNAMLSGYAQDGTGKCGQDALLMFLEMVKEGWRLDHITLTSAVSACGHERNIEIGRQIHGLSFKRGYAEHVSVGNVLMSMYSKSEAVDDAKLVFNAMRERNVVSWTTLISIGENVVSLFKKMRLDGVYPNDVTCVAVLHSLTENNLVEEGEMIHGFCLKTSFTSNLNVSNSLITMYAAFKSMDNSLKVFGELVHRDIISWNALISGYAQNGQSKEAIEMFFLVMGELQPTHYTYGSVLNAIGAAEDVSLRHGQRCHANLIKLGVNGDPIVSGALLDMYAKRGSIDESLKVFHETRVRTQFAWTAMISAHARHGDGQAVIELFHTMTEEGIRPDSITFLSVLAACSRQGLLEVGQQVFDSMTNDYLIEPSPEHYSCMVDMLGRAGKLHQAEDVVNKIPGGPTMSVLQSLLGSCRVHGDVEMAQRMGDKLIEIEPTESGSYVLLSNMYAEKGQWEKVAEVRIGMRERGVKKEVGLSWVDTGRGDAGGDMYLHGFSSGDLTHPRSEDIYRMADWLGAEMQELRKEDWLGMEGNAGNERGGRH